jgi:RNA polymerase sigma-70 factor (ECF subfamily)
LEDQYNYFDSSFIDVYDKNHAFLVRYLFFLVNDLNTAEDLAHDIFLRLYKSKNVHITNLKFRNYIKTAARNIVIDHLRRLEKEEAKKRRMIPILEELNEIIYSSLENSIIEGEIVSTVRDVLDEFSEKNQKVFVSRIIDHKSRRQISEEEKISTYIVKRIEYEILYILRKKLKHFFDY